MQIQRLSAISTLSLLFLCLTIVVLNQYIINIQLTSSIKKLYKNIGSQDISDIKFDTEIIKSRSHFDETANYKIINYVYTGNEWTHLTKFPLCIALHCSVDRMHYLPNFMISWSGPLSVAIFAPGVELDITLHYINYLTTCYSSIRSKVSFHVVIMSKEEQYEALHADTTSWNCDDNAVDILHQLLNLRSNTSVAWRKNILFPINVLRNVARNTCQSPWLSNLDIDMVLPKPSPIIQPNITTQLVEFLTSDTAENCNKCAFIIPIFEISSNVTDLPSNKDQLKTLVKENLARTFYLKVYGQSQSPSEQESKWLNLSNSTGIKVVYQPNYKLKYEPLYVAKKGTPNFDERYLQNGMNRDSQVYEMYLANYTFHMLDNIFLNHLGFKTPKTFNKDYVKITHRNVMIFEKLAHRQLAAKYDRDPLNLLHFYAQRKYPHTVKINL